MARRWWPALGAIVGIAIGFAVGYWLAGNDIGKPGDWRYGAQRFVGFAGALGGGLGYVVGRALSGGIAVTRDGFTLSYRRIDPEAEGYREQRTLTVDRLVAVLAKFGYEPRAEACNDEGTPLGPLEPETPLASANVAIRDRGVRGWIRLQPLPPVAARPRALGILEIWSERGESAEELALFVLRALDGLLVGLTATRESSRLGEDPVSMLAAGLAERPMRRKV